MLGWCFGTFCGKLWYIRKGCFLCWYGGAFNMCIVRLYVYVTVFGAFTSVKV